MSIIKLALKNENYLFSKYFRRETQLLVFHFSLLIFHF